MSQNSEQHIGLSRDLGLLDVTMIGVGGMIGAGIFVLTGIAAGEAGPALVLAFFLNGIVTTLTAMGYAELGSAFPIAGGSYVWVKEGLGGAQGFLAGWMSWFATSVAGTLYAIGFGRFATELWHMADLPAFGLSIDQMSLFFMSAIVLFFMAVNYRGASEAGTVGNIVTTGKVVILGIFVVAGLIAMTRTDVWVDRFTEGFLPNGLGGIFVAMGVTFIAFEGYEIIAQSGEEVIDPKRNIPRAIFASIAIVVPIYMLVAFVAIGATEPEGGLPVYEYLAQKKEVAIVESAGQFLPYGAILLLISGLASTMSALNATTYSASRVSFAMGRDHNLPPFFARIHSRRHTPYGAVMATAVLIVFMGWIFEIEQVAAASDIMFLLLFFQVDVVVMVLRRKLPNLDRGYTIPWFPLIPILALITLGGLAALLFTFSPTAWYVAGAWILVGLLAYYAYFSKIEEIEKPKEILLEEVLVSRDYSVLVPIATQEQARILGRIGAVLAQDNGGEVFALNVVRVPPQLTLGDGRLFLKEGRPYLETVIEQSRQRDVPVHTMIRLGRDVAEAIRKTALEDASDLIVLGWPGYTNTAGRLFGSVVDTIVDNPPTDLAIVRYRAYRPLRSILVPVAGGWNSRLAVKLAVSMARQAEGGCAKITVLHVLPPGSQESERVRAEQVIKRALNGVVTDPCAIDRSIVEGASVVDAVLQTAPAYDLIVVGATDEPLFQNLLVGNVAQRIARDAEVTTIMVKRRSGPIRSMLRQTVLAPSTVDAQPKDTI